MPFFGVCQLRDPLIDFKKNWQSGLSRGPHPTCKNWGQLVQNGRVCACVKLSPSGVYFFLFLGFMRIATGRPVGPIVVINGSNDLFMVSLIRKIFFPIFYQKIWKIALHPMGTLNSYSFGIVEDTYKLFAPNGGFRGRAIKWCHSNLPQTDPCCHGNQS